MSTARGPSDIPDWHRYFGIARRGIAPGSMPRREWSCAYGSEGAIPKDGGRGDGHASRDSPEQAFIVTYDKAMQNAHS